MKCKNCGKPIKQENRYCAYCGARNVLFDAQQDPGAAENKRQSPAKKRSAVKWLLPLAACILILCVAVGFYIRQQRIKAVSNEAYEAALAELERELPERDAETYYEERSEILNVVDVKSSTSVSSEKEVSAELSARGFDTFPVSSDYTMDGAYYEAAPVSESSGEKHPMYTTYHVSPEVYWTIYEINGSIMAYPFSYNLQSTRGVQIILAETDVITSYDSQENCFYETIPDGNALLVIRIDHIDADALDRLTVEMLDTM